jgi:hypothetical protein
MIEQQLNKIIHFKIKRILNQDVLESKIQNKLYKTILRTFKSFNKSKIDKFVSIST